MLSKAAPFYLFAMPSSANIHGKGMARAGRPSPACGGNIPYQNVLNRPIGQNVRIRLNDSHTVQHVQWR
jgi:hypothetical protein